MRVEDEKLRISEKLTITFEPDEIIKLITKPVLKASLGNETLNIFFGLLFMAGAIGLFNIIAYLFNSTFAWDTTLIFFGIISAISVIGSIIKILKLRATTYVITNLRIIIHHNNYSSIQKSINISDIKSRELIQTIIDKYYKTGTIKIFTGETKNNEGKSEDIYENIDSIFECEKAYAIL